jgi:uncharacterized protein (DUF305 family)
MPLIMIKDISDYRISLNSIYGSFFMGSSMILSMSFTMKLSNLTIIMNSIIVVLSVIALRNQTFVSDTFFLLDMIPHHSMALQTSSHILEKTKDPRIRELAKNIYDSQIKEINYMKSLLQ